MPEASRDDHADTRPSVLRSLASKFSIFMAILVFWVVLTLLAYDMRQDNFNLGKGMLLCVIVALVSGAISRFTIRLLTRPLKLLQDGIVSVRNGRLEPIQVSRTGDEIEFLGETFNAMIEALAESRSQIRGHNELLEQRIKGRTAQFEEATRRAEAASQAKSEFLANLSRELSKPINSVIGIVDIALQKHLSREEVDELQNAQECAQSLLSLLNDILDLSKIEAGKMILDKALFDIRALLAECIKTHEPQASRIGIELRADVTPEVPAQISGDPTILRQILSNLLSNAVQFTEHGSVVIRVDGNSSGAGEFSLRLAVQDTGTGIPAGKLLSIFDTFTHVDGNVSPLRAGAGLGLAITRKLVELQGGEISVESEPGRGSTFIVTLPCAAGDVNPDKGRGTEQAPAQGVGVIPSTARILVVEDNPVNQKVVTVALRKRGYVIELANDGQEALNKLASRGDFDLILMDVQMPVLDGLETTRLIRSDPRWKDVPIVAMTAHAMTGDKERCLEAGMNGYISKPVHPSHLLATLEEYLALRSESTH